MPENNNSTSKRLEIKKYPNRRYYDATRSRHVTLEEINSLIREGYEVQVTDSKTGQDITAKVLAQIILELDSPKLDVFPVPLLHRLIRANEQLVTDFVEKYFNQALAAFLDSQRTFEQSVRQAMGLQSSLGVPDWAKLMWGPFTPSLWSGPRSNRTGNAAAPAPSPEPPPQPENARDMRHAVDELRQQLDELQRQLAAQSNHKKKRPHPSR